LLKEKYCVAFLVGTSVLALFPSSKPDFSRRTFTPAILGFSHSTETLLRHPGCAQYPGLPDGHGPPLTPVNSEENPAEEACK